jgi:pyruvate/2-oxoglutarate dehydrogenase complex dihydrolipoamide dehydrogenase (E3) component
VFDAIVIGAGQAGSPLAGVLAGAGQRVLLVERRELGGTCVNDGCIPTKTLIASARAAHVVRAAARFGVVVDGAAHVDMAAVKARKDAVVKESVDGIASWLASLATLTVKRGHARFVADRTIEVDGERFAAPRVFLNTGARALVPDVPGLRDVALTNTGMMKLDRVPEHLVVVGSSYVAVELAQAMRRFGSRVTILARGDRLLSREDEDIARTIEEVFAAEGIDVVGGASLERVEATARGARLFFRRRDSARDDSLDATHVLVATGRRPNTDDLALDKAGIAVDAHGYVVVDDQLRSTSAAGVWALGDVNGKGAFTHTSYNDYEVVAANVVRGEARTIANRIFIACVYCDPALGRVGMNEAAARASGRTVLCGARPMTRVNRARAKGETAGVMKILVDAESRTILGASILGPDADEAVHAVAAAMTAGMTADAFSRAVFAHPTLAELLPTIAGELTPLDSR